VSEVFFEREFGVETTYSALGGAIWQVRDTLALDAAFRVASVEGMFAEELRFGFTWAFPVWGPPGAPANSPATLGRTRWGRM
jgi:hypothetical protein